MNYSMMTAQRESEDDAFNDNDTDVFLPDTLELSHLKGRRSKGFRWLLPWIAHLILFSTSLSILFLAHRTGRVEPSSCVEKQSFYCTLCLTSSVHHSFQTVFL